MKRKVFTCLIIIITSYVQKSAGQEAEITFLHHGIDFLAPPRTKLSPMSIKLWDNYNTAAAPSAFGTVLEIYGLNGHQTSQLYFGGWDNSKIRYREAFYAQSTWSDWITMLDSKNNVESAGSLMVSGSANHYITGGNLGIGTSNPSSRLDVLGGITSHIVSIGQNDGFTSTKNYVNFSSNNHGSLLLSSNLYIQGNDELKIAKTHGSLSGASMLIPGNGQPNQGSIIFYNNAPGAVVEGQNFTGNALMYLGANSQVGIGTTQPKEKLSVNGKIRAHEIKVETANWPDYVFEDSYKILPLVELDRYIKENKHLPEMPTAANIEKNGLALGEIVKLQQQKIEELTLHLIEKDKQVADLLSVTQKLERRINSLEVNGKK